MIPWVWYDGQFQISVLKIHKRYGKTMQTWFGRLNSTICNASREYFILWSPLLLL